VKLHNQILAGMVVGLLAGLAFGPSGLVLPRDGVILVVPGEGLTAAPDATAPALPLTRTVRRATVVGEADGWLEVEAPLRARDLLKLRAADVEGADGLRPGARVRGYLPDRPDRVDRYSTIGQALVDGTEWIGRLFLALIQMVVVPLVFLSLVGGVASLGDLRTLGRLGSRTLGLFLASTLLALGWGVGLANLLRPGALMGAEDSQRLLRSFGEEASGRVQSAAEAPSLVDQIVGIIPSNPIAALASGDMLPIIFFALMLGIALTMLPSGRATLVVDVFDRLNDAIVQLVHLAMRLAPFGVAALLFKVAGTTGPTVLVALAAYCGVVLLGLALHLAVTYGIGLYALARVPLPRLMGGLREAMLLAFSTSSSSATLPVTKECLEENLGVHPQVTSFVLPLGATVNMDGTALYQGVAALFIAQIYGLDLGPIEQLTIVGTATLASIGAAGVPGAGMITLVLVLTAVGVPTEGLALILGVDRLLDMLRTVVNVVGDASVALIVDRIAGPLPPAGDGPGTPGSAPTAAP
jgi:proton glutamate symport protein